MRRLALGLVGTLASVALVSAAVPAFAQPPAHDTGTGTSRDKHSLSDDLTTPEERERRALRAQALQKVLDGTATPTERNGSTVIPMGKSKKGKPKYVELQRQRTDQLFVLPVEFGNERHPDFPDKDTDPDIPGPTTFEGPAHNAIEAPDRKTDNTKIWAKDFGRKYYQDLVFGKSNSMKAFYEKASSGRYSITGEVTDWVKLKYNEARYGRNFCGNSTCPNAWELVRDALGAWVEQQKAAGKTPEQIKAHITKYDQWDRYDFDGDGNFNEADGYLDHLLLVHAGEDESAGGGAQGEDAIWAHRWAAFSNVKDGPKSNPSGGTEVPGTGIWAEDYTVQPENGGLGVFAHEYGHDLGLPDHYDTTGKADNGVGFWSLMASGSWLSNDPTNIGSAAGDFLAWDKYQLGWLNYAQAKSGDTRTLDLGPAEYNTKLPQALLVRQPKKTRTTVLAKPAEGTKAWWSTMGDDLNTTLTRSVAIPADKPAELSFKAWYEIEDCGCDYAYVEVDAGDGKGFTSVKTNLSKGAEEFYAIAGTTEGKWVDGKADLSAYAGKTVQLRFRYATDGGFVLRGLLVDTVALTSGGTPVFSDGAENGDNGWTAKGFRATTGAETKEYTPYYLVENRGYRGPDTALKNGPYNFGDRVKQPNWAERYSYLPGLLITQWDPSVEDNNVSKHPGEGRILPIDTNGKALTLADGKTPLRGRIQTFDAPLRLTAGQPFTLTFNGVATQIPGAPKVIEFNDHTGTYFDPLSPFSGVKTRDTNTRIVLKSVNKDVVRISLLPAKRPT